MPHIHVGCMNMLVFVPRRTIHLHFMGETQYDSACEVDSLAARARVLASTCCAGVRAVWVLGTSQGWGGMVEGPLGVS